MQVVDYQNVDYKKAFFQLENVWLTNNMKWIRDDPPFMGEVAKGVILLVPIYNASERCWKIFERALYRLDPLPEKVVFCENNSTNDTLSKIWAFKLPHEVIRIWIRKDAGKVINIAAARDLLLTRARTYGAKTALFLDDDIIPFNRDILKTIKYNKLDLCCGNHCGLIPVNGVVSVVTNGGFITDLPKPTIYRFNFEALEESEQKLCKIDFAGGAFFALGEKVIKDTRLNYFPIHKVGDPEDIGFCRQANELGYRIIHDYSLKFVHLVDNFKN